MASMKILYPIVSIIIYAIMAKAQVDFQGKSLYGLYQDTTNWTRISSPAKGSL